jgi:hypothetical protein
LDKHRTTKYPLSVIQGGTIPLAKVNHVNFLLKESASLALIVNSLMKQKALSDSTIVVLIQLLAPANGGKKSEKKVYSLRYGNRECSFLM